ncbi:hypothetical protein CTI12_AA176640 [Artemisia annua]|uniref:KIB1-4 beta-propeller domain-containing protein n=1 Tax=Artemisia annua TaxID=35608 RepID=A0A2U1P9A1_ARTAN|nr:hypothetical protein CTI12_AA176640 [Artemisia annua]
MIYGVSNFKFAACLMMLVGAISYAFLLYAPEVFGLAAVQAGLTLFMGMRVVSEYISKGLRDSDQLLPYFAISKLGEQPTDGITDANLEGMIVAFRKWTSTLAATLQAGDVSCKVNRNFLVIIMLSNLINSSEVLRSIEVGLMEQISSNSVCDRLPPLSSKYPWLISQNLEAEEHNTNDQFFCTIHELPHYRCQIPELLGKRIRGCFHGWVILSSHPHNVKWSLWNPMTSKIIRLPTLTMKDGDYESIDECCLSAPPVDSSSIFLLTRTNKSTFLFCPANVNVDIVVTHKKVEIKLIIFGVHPLPSSNHYGGNTIEYLKGSSKDLFYIVISFQNDTTNVPAQVNIFKSDMTCVNWEERECLNHWDLTDFTGDGVQWDDLGDWHLSCKTWEEMDDVKDKIFFVDLARDGLVSSSCVIASELGGYVHIRSELGDTIYSYHVKSNTISVFAIPSPMMPTSYVSIWECRLEDNNGEAKSIVDSKVEMENNDEVLLRSGTDDGVEYSESHLLNVPFHVLETIMEHFVGVEYRNFRATCKKCHLAAPLRNWSNTTSLGRLQNTSLRRLQTESISKIATDRFSQLYCSRFGWLLFESYDFPCLVLFNPFTNDLRKLPEANYSWESLCFSAPPTSPDCMVVGFTTQGNWHAHIHFVNRKSTWRKLHLRPDLDPHTIRFSSVCGRNLYALCEEGELTVFNNLGEQSYSWELVETVSPKSCCGSLTQGFLAENDQHLFLVRVCDYGKHVEVFKLNDSKREWEKIDGLGKHVIYICGTSCLCIKAKTPQLQNKIFFPHLHTKTRKIMFYSLDTCMYHTFDDKNQEHLRDFVGTTFLLSHVWIEPSWS